MIKCHSAVVEYTQEGFLFSVQSSSYYFAREQEKTHLMLLCHQVAGIDPQSSHSKFFVAFH